MSKNCFPNLGIGNGQKLKHFNKVLFQLNEVHFDKHAHQTVTNGGGSFNAEDLGSVLHPKRWNGVVLAKCGRLDSIRQNGTFQAIEAEISLLTGGLRHGDDFARHTFFRVSEKNVSFDDGSGTFQPAAGEN